MQVSTCVFAEQLGVRHRVLGHGDPETGICPNIQGHGTLIATPVLAGVNVVLDGTVYVYLDNPTKGKSDVTQPSIALYWSEQGWK